MNEWISVFLRESNGLPVFPREMLFLGSAKKRIVVNDIMDFIKFIEAFDVDCYTSVYSQWQQVNSVFDTIPLDIDGETIEVSYDKYMKVSEILNDQKLRRVCSARGFHIYVDYKPMSFKNYPEAVRRWIKDKGLEDLVDVQVAVDIRRVLRVLYTLNSKVNLFAVPISENDNFDKIKNRIKLGWGASVKPIEWNDDVREELEKFDGQVREVGKGKIKGVNYFNENSSIADFPPCIREIMKGVIMTGKLKHIGRLILGIFLVKIWDYEKILKFFGETLNYNERKTIFQIDTMLERGYNVHNCTTISTTSEYCQYKDDFEKCPFYPNITRFC